MPKFPGGMGGEKNIFHQDGHNEILKFREIYLTDETVSYVNRYHLK